MPGTASGLKKQAFAREAPTSGHACLTPLGEQTAATAQTEALPIAGPRLKIFPPPAETPPPRTANLKALKCKLSKGSLQRRNSVFFRVRLAGKWLFSPSLRIGHTRNPATDTFLTPLFGVPEVSWAQASGSGSEARPLGNTRGGTRTRNLLLRREAPYPLGHTSFCTAQRARSNNS